MQKKRTSKEEKTCNNFQSCLWRLPASQEPIAPSVHGLGSTLVWRTAGIWTRPRSSTALKRRFLTSTSRMVHGHSPMPLGCLLAKRKRKSIGSGWSGEGVPSIERAITWTKGCHCFCGGIFYRFCRCLKGNGRGTATIQNGIAGAVVQWGERERERGRSRTMM